VLELSGGNEVGNETKLDIYLPYLGITVQRWLPFLLVFRQGPVMAIPVWLCVTVVIAILVLVAKKRRWFSFPAALDDIPRVSTWLPLLLSLLSLFLSLSLSLSLHLLI